MQKQIDTPRLDSTAPCGSSASDNHAIISLIKWPAKMVAHGNASIRGAGGF
jgi:hypothetical protein